MDSADCDFWSMTGQKAGEYRNPVYPFKAHIHSYFLDFKGISYIDLKIKAGKTDGKWVVYPIKKSVQRLCGKMQFNPDDLTELQLMGG